MTDTSSQDTFLEDRYTDITRVDWYYALHALWDLLDMLRKRKPSKVAPEEALAYQQLRSMLLRTLGGHPSSEDINHRLPQTIADIPKGSFALLYDTQILPALICLKSGGPHDLTMMVNAAYCEKGGQFCRASYLQILKQRAELYREQIASRFTDVPRKRRKERRAKVVWYLKKLKEEIRELSADYSAQCKETECLPLWKEAALVQANPDDPTLKLYDRTSYEISALTAQVRTMREAAGMPPTRDSSGPDGAQDSPEEAEQHATTGERTTEHIEDLIAAIKELAGEHNEKRLSYAEIARKLHGTEKFSRCDVSRVAYAVTKMRKQGETWHTKYGNVRKR